jgi:hypothetical protein
VNASTILILSLLFSLLALVALRSERRPRRWIVLFVPVPLAYLIVRWAMYRQAWVETGIALALPLAALAIWWVTIGRRVPAPEDTNRVWTKDAPF